MVKVNKTHSSGLNGDVLILVAMAIFGTYGLFLRKFTGVSTLAFLFSFQVIGALAFFPSAKKAGLKLKDIKLVGLLLILAVVALGNDLTYFSSLRDTSIANATISHQSVSIFLLFLAPLILKLKTMKDEWLALVIALAGIFIIFHGDISLHDSKDILGISLGLLSGLAYALLLIMYKILSSKNEHLPVSVINFWRYIISVIILLPLIGYFNISSLGSHNLIAVVSFGITFAVIATVLHTMGITKARSLHASIIGKSEPVFAILYAFIFLSEKPSLTTIVGGFLIIAAGICLVWRDKYISDSLA